MKPNYLHLLFLALVGMIQSCGFETTEQTYDSSLLNRASEEEVEQLVESFILAEDSSTITLPEGFFDIQTQLILDNKTAVKIKGAGMDKTVLSFRNLSSGGEGVKIVGRDIILEDFTIEDAPGDGIKSQHTDGITFRRINVTWTNGEKSKNGTYAIYPVQCKNVLIEECIASHSKDAGIYVGQSENIVVKNSLAFGNVAGIEIENCDNAEVFGNTVRHNSGGILVFNLPGLPKSDGKATKIYDNHVFENNHKNFATPLGEDPNGNTVTMIPPGSGIVLLAAKEVEIFNNKIEHNKTAGIAIASYQVTGFPAEAPNWSPYTSSVFVHDNTYLRKGFSLPDFSRELGKLISVYNAHGFGKGQDIIYDGIWDESISSSIDSNPMKICFSESMENLRFTRFYLMEGEDHIESFSDFEKFQNCSVTVQTNVNMLAQAK